MKGLQKFKKLRGFSLTYWRRGHNIPEHLIKKNLVENIVTWRYSPKELSYLSHRNCLWQNKICLLLSYRYRDERKNFSFLSQLSTGTVAGRQRGFKRFKTEWVFFSCDTDTPLKKNWANFLFQQLQFVCPKVLGWIPTRLDIISFQGFPFRLLGDFPRLHCVVELGSTIWCNTLQFWSFPFVTVLLISFLCGYKINCYHFLVDLFFCWHPVLIVIIYILFFCYKIGCCSW